MADFLKELFDNVDKYENGTISYKEAKAVNRDILERITKEYGETKPIRAIITQIRNSSLIMLKEAKLKHDLENRKIGLPKGDYVNYGVGKDFLYDEAVKAYKKVCDNHTPIKDKNGNIISTMGLVFRYPSQTLSTVGRKYVYLHNTDGILAKYVIKTGEIIA